MRLLEDGRGRCHGPVHCAGWLRQNGAGDVQMLEPMGSRRQQFERAEIGSERAFSFKWGLAALSVAIAAR